MSYNVREHSYVVGGLGVTGQACVRFLLQKQATVKAFDTRANFTLVTDPDSDIDTDMQAFMAEKVTCTALSEDYFDGVDTLVLSPGLALNIEQVALAQKCGVEVIGDVELFARLNASTSDATPAKRVVGITGSNGKTTTVNMLIKMCQSENIRGSLAGNVGIPFSSSVLEEMKSPEPKTVYVLEISSFQMEFIEHFKPYIAIFLNITPDHLNRYPSMKEYIAAKMNMWSRQTAEDFIVYNADDTILVEEIAESTSRKIAFGLGHHPEAIFQPNRTKIYTEEHATLIEMNQLALPGKHNLANALAAATAAHLMGVPNKSIAATMSQFSGVPHRLEPIAEINGVTYINDSKATNLDAVQVALESFTQPIILLLGGLDKGGDFRSLLPHTHNNLKEVIAFGQAKELILTALRDAVRSTSVMDLKEALELAQNCSQPGDVVLLSPGCASFDQFNNFEERGNYFRSLVTVMEKA